MCFSALASFSAGTVIAAVGAISVTRARTVPQYALAGIPLIFSVQQFSEGFLWLSFSNTPQELLQNIPMYIFLVFAQLVWPVYVPLTVFVHETDPGRKKGILFLLILGILTSLYLLYCMFSYPITASADGHHIKYHLNFPLANKWYTGVTYILATMASPLRSSHKRLKYLGLLLLISYGLTQILFRGYLISVWCFFAAALSVFILCIISVDRKPFVHRPIS